MNTAKFAMVVKCLPLNDNVQYVTYLVKRSDK